MKRGCGSTLLSHLFVASSEGKEEEEKETGEKKEAYRTGIWFIREMTPGAVSAWCFCVVRQWTHACVMFRRLFGRFSFIFRAFGIWRSIVRCLPVRRRSGFCWETTLGFFRGIWTFF